MDTKPFEPEEKMIGNSIINKISNAYLIKLTRNRLGFTGFCILSFFIVLAIFAPYVAPYDPESYSGTPFSAPNWNHPLGTNDVGQDILSELIFGTRISLLVGVISATIGIVLGSLLGILSGSSPGFIDTALMRIVDILLAIPFIPLMIVIGVYFGPGLFTEIIVISGLIWAISAREIRSKILSILEQDHILAAKSMGATKLHIILNYLLPNVFPIVISQFVRAISVAILLETSLSFLGLGDSTAKSWGTMLFFANARSAFLTDAWIWWVLPPGLLITITVLSFAFMGYVLEEQNRPQLRIHNKKTKTKRNNGSIAHFHTHSSLENKDDNHVLKIRGLTVGYSTDRGIITALNNVNLDILKGQIIGIIGESGSGKSTLAIAILGMLKAPAMVISGEIVILNQNLASMKRSKLRQVLGGRIALVPQNSMNALNPVFTVVKQVAESIMIHKKISKSKALTKSYGLLQQVGISKESANMYPHELSGGMRQRVLIAMALSNDPNLIIADEPTTGLDVILQAEILKTLADLRDCRGLSVLLISHDIKVALSIADEIAVMQSGKIVENDSAKKIRSQQKHPYTHRLLHSLPKFGIKQNTLTNNGDGITASQNINISEKETGISKNHSVIQFSHVKKSFDAQRNGSKNVVLEDVSFSISTGEIVGLIGGSGVGKSTIAKLIMGLLRQDGGDILFEGKYHLSDVSSSKRKQLSKYVHLVFQDPYDSLPSHMNIRKIVQEPLKIHNYGTKKERDKLTLDVLDKVSLLPASKFIERYPHELSGGERQRVALARALILRPKLIVADEPTTMLDASLRLDLLKLMKSFRDDYGISYLYITHDISLASVFCDRLLVMHKGKIVDEGKPEELISNPNHYYSNMLVDAAKTIRGANPNVV